MKSIGVNPHDAYLRTGGHVIKPALPYTPGIDGSGIVEEVGESVTKLKVHVYTRRSFTLTIGHESHRVAQTDKDY